MTSREGAARRVSEESGSWMDRPQLAPSAPGSLLVDAQRLDAHAGDRHDLHRQVEVPFEATLADLLALVIEPFLRAAPRSDWHCRVGGTGRWQDFAEATWDPPRQHLSAHLFAEDRPARELAAEGLIEIACRPR